MLELAAKIRKDLGKKVKIARRKGVLPAVLYGPRMKESLSLDLDLKEFEKLYKEAGETSMMNLKIEGHKEKGANLVLVKDISKDPVTDKFLHIDFYQPNLEEKMEVTVPLVFEGEALAVKDLGGTLVKNINQVKVKCLPDKLPKEIKVNIGKLNTFNDNITIKELILPEGVSVMEKPEEIIALVAHPQKVEEELVKPIEEKVEEVEKIEKKKKEEVIEEKPQQ